MDINRKFLDLDLAETPNPGRHDAVLWRADLRGDGRLAGPVEPDRIGQIGRAKLRVAFCIIAMTGDAIFGENIGAGL